MALDIYKHSLKHGICLLIIALVTWLRASYSLAQLTEPDPGLFESMAYHLTHGKLLYTQIIDHKPPFIFYLNAACLHFFGPTENTINYVVLASCLVIALLVYLVFYKLVKNCVLATLFTLFSIISFLQQSYFGSGNYTEFWGAICVVLALYFGYIKKQTPLLAIFLVLACFFKETFVFSCIGFFIGYFALEQKKQIIKFIYWSVFVLGAILLWMAASNLLMPYVQQFIYSQKYVQASGLSLLTRLYYNTSYFLAFTHLSAYMSWSLYLVCIWVLVRYKFWRNWVIPILGMQIFDFLATALSGHYFAHYYLQNILISSFIICMGLYLLLAKTKIGLSALSIIIIPLLLISGNTQYHWKWNPEKSTTDPIIDWLNVNAPATNRSMALGGFDVGFYYLKAKGLCPFPYISPYNYHYAGSKKEQELVLHNYRSLFLQTKPEFVIYSGTYSNLILATKLNIHIDTAYTQVQIADLKTGFTAHLLQLKHK